MRNKGNCWCIGNSAGMAWLIFFIAVSDSVNSRICLLFQLAGKFWKTNHKTACLSVKKCENDLNGNASSMRYTTLGQIRLLRLETYLIFTHK